MRKKLALEIFKVNNNNNSNKFERKKFRILFN